MANQNEIRIIISADGSAAVRGISGVNTAIERLQNGTSQINQSMSNAVSGISKGFVALSVAIGSAIAGIHTFKRALQPLEDYQMNMAQITALTITFMEKTKNMTIADQYQKAKLYAQGLVPVLEQIAAKTLLSSQETIDLTTALMKQGVFLDANNEKAKQGFIALSNAIAVMTQGQNRTVQLQQEVRALMEGNNVAGASLLNMIKAQNPAIEENIKRWRQQGTVLENLLTYLQGFNAVSGDLEMTWGSLSTTIRSTIESLLRGGLKTAYDEAMQFLSRLNKWLYENGDTIKYHLSGAWHTVKSAIESVMAVVRPLWNLVKPVVSMIIEGLLIIANAILPVVAQKIGGVVEFVKALLSSVSKIFQTAVALLQGDLATVREIFKGWEKDGEDMSKAWEKIFDKDLGGEVARRYNDFIAARQKATDSIKKQDSEIIKGQVRPDYSVKSQMAKARVIEIQEEINEIKRAYDIEKLYAQDRLEAIEDMYKRMSLTDKEYYSFKKQEVEKNLQLEGDLIIATARKIYEKYEAEITAIRAEALAQGKTADTTAKEVEVLKRRNTALNELLVHGTQAHLNYTKQMRALDTQDLLNNLSKQLVAIEHRYKMEKIYAVMILDDLDTNIELQREKVRYLYEDMNMSASEYYMRLIELQNQATDNKLNRLQKEYDAEIRQMEDIKKAKISAGGLTDKDKQELDNKLLQLEAEYQANRTKIIREANKERTQLERDYALATKTFYEGIIDGAKEYLKQIELTSEKGKALFLDVAKNIEDALVKLFDKPKDAIKDLFSYFLNTLKRMAVQAIANPVILPIAASISGAVGGIFGAASPAQANMIGQAGSAYSMGAGLGLFPSVNPFGQGGFGGWFNGLFGGGYGSGLTYTNIPFNDIQHLDAFGSITPQQAQAMGYAGLTPLGYLTSGAGLLLGGYNLFRGVQNSNPFQAGLGGLGAGLGGASLINALAGSAIINPLVGGIALAIAGVLGGLFNKKKDPSFSFLYNPDGKNPFWDRATYTEGAYGVSTYGFEMPAEQQRMIVEGYQRFMEGMKDMFGRFGRQDIADAFSRIGGGATAPIHVEGKTPEEIERAMKVAWGTTIGTILKETDKNLYDMVLKLQKAGEDFGEAVVRIMTAISEIPKIEQSINDYIAAIQNSYDGIAKFKDQMQTAQKGIDDLRKKLIDTADPVEQIGILNQLKNAIYEKYMLEKQMVESLVSEIEQAEIAMFNFNFNLQQKIDQLTNSANTSAMALSRMQYALDRYNYYQGQGNAAMSMNWLNEYIAGIDNWLLARQREIQERYRLMQEAEQKAIKAQQETIEAENKQIEGELKILNEQRQVLQGWESLLDSITKTITNLRITESNPQDVFERLGIAQGEVAKYLSLYQSATGEDKVKYAGSLQDAIQDYLKLAQEAYQRPSPEYQAIYDQALQWLEMIQRDAVNYADEGKRIDEQIKRLQERQNQLQEESNQLQQRMTDYTQQMQAELDALNQEAAGYYEWARNEGIRLYQEKIDELKRRLGEIIGDRTVEEYLSDLQLAAVTELVQIRDILQKIKDQMGIGGVNPVNPTIPNNPILPVNPTPTNPSPYPYIGNLSFEDFVRQYLNAYLPPDWMDYGAPAHWWELYQQYLNNSHKTGLDYVPYDDYPARLHRGEMVLTADAANRYREDSGGVVISPTITINVSGDVDERKIADKVVSTIEKSVKHGRLRTIIKEV